MKFNKIFHNSMDNTYLQEKITKTKAIIDAIDDALLFLSLNPTKSYRLDTGQSVQNVERANIKEINEVRNSLYNQLCVMETRLTGNGSQIGIPAW